MKKVFLALIILCPFIMQSQEYDSWERLNNDPMHRISRQIKQDVAWEEILLFIQNDSILKNKDFASEVSSTIDLINKMQNPKNPIDEFLYSICMTYNVYFRYNRSGLLQKSYRGYSAENINYTYKEVHGKEIDERKWGRSNFRFSEILKSTKNEIIPRLIHFLSDHSATRHVVDGWDWDDPSYYLSVSDIAMELLEIYTLCDFHDNRKIFSNRPAKEREEIIGQIEKWWTTTKDLERVEATHFFLDSISDLDHSYFLTCNNILDYGDTLLATVRYRQFYLNFKKPCAKHGKSGEKLYELGDNVFMDDCIRDVYDFQCQNDASNCIKFIIENASSPLQYKALAEVVGIEQKRVGAKNGEKFKWHYIFSLMVNTETKWSNPILIELLKIKEIAINLKIPAYIWQQKYPLQHMKNSRICDFALIKYAELNPELGLEFEWFDQRGIDLIIENIIEKQ